MIDNPKEKPTSDAVRACGYLLAEAARLTQELDNAHTDYALLSDDYKQLLLDVKSAQAHLQQLQEGIAEAQRALTCRLGFPHYCANCDNHIGPDRLDQLAALLPRPPKEEQ